jgi:hypothetical protein
MVTLSNDPSNMAVQKVWEQAKEIAAIADLIYLYSYNTNIECNYTITYAKLEAL